MATHRSTHHAINGTIWREEIKRIALITNGTEIDPPKNRIPIGFFMFKYISNASDGHGLHPTGPYMA